MELLKLKRAAQLTLPVSLRQRFNLKIGDYVEAVVVEDGILLKPVTVIEKKKAWNEVFQSIDNVVDSQAHQQQSPQEQEEEITQMVKDFRNEHR